MFRKVAIVAVTSLALVGCANQDMGNKQAGGALIGAGVGALLGSKVGGGSGKLAATAIGAVAGGLLGSSIGQSLDRADQSALERNTTRAYTSRLNEPIVWDNPSNGNQVIVTPTREGRTSGGNYCREFQQTITVGGRSEQAYGTACQQPDGSWKIVS